MKQTKVCYYNPTPQDYSINLSVLEKQLRLLAIDDLIKIERLDQCQNTAHDLIIIYGDYIPKENFLPWLERLVKEREKKGELWVPAIIISSLDFADINAIWDDLLQSNWYFDLVHPDHLSSLAIRCINLLRIKDHLHELGRYEKSISELSEKVIQLEKKVQSC